MATQLRDYHGNPIDPKTSGGGGGGTTANNHWEGGKICILGTSVAWGSNSSRDVNPLDETQQGHAYCLEASKILNFTAICGACPGLALHAYKVVYRNASNVQQTCYAPLTYGSSCLSKAEYSSWCNDIRPKIVDGTYTIVSCSDPSFGNYGTQAEWANARTMSSITFPSTMPAWTPDRNQNSYARTWENVFNESNQDVNLWVFATLPNNTDFADTDWNAFKSNEWGYSDDSRFEEHRSTFLGAMLFMLDKMYALNPYARMVLVADSAFAYTNVNDMKTMATSWKLPLIDLYAKMNITPKGNDIFRSIGGTDPHPSGYAQMLMGRIFANELLLIA